MKDIASANKVYIRYADTLMQAAEKFVEVHDEEDTPENRNWFMAVNYIKNAIEFYQNNGGSEKALNAQKRLVEIQKLSVKYMQMHEFKFDVTDIYKKFSAEYENHDINELIWDVVFSFGFQNKQKIRETVTRNTSPLSTMFPMHMLGADGQTKFVLPGLQLDDENSILLHMYHRARKLEKMQGETYGVWFIQYFRKLGLKEADLDLIFENNPIIPEGQAKDVQRGVYYGLIGRMSDALDKLAPKVENIIRNLAEMCGDLMTYYDYKEGIQQKRVLSQVFAGEKLNECIDENVLFTFDGLLQQKAGSNIRNEIGHGLSTEAECNSGDCIYFVMIVLKFCALYSKSYKDEAERRRHERTLNSTDNDSKV